MNSFIYKILKIIILTAVLSGLCLAQKRTLKVLDINVWSGLTYKGTIKMGEYESERRREKRFSALLIQIRASNPDVILIQEANPVVKYASRLGDSLSYDEIHFICNAGIKFGPLGIPSNLSEGQVILARPELDLEEYDIWKHSGAIGINSDNLNIHFDESIYSLVGKIKIDDKPVLIVNTHLYSALPMDSNLISVIDNLHHDGRISDEVYEEAYDDLLDGYNRQKEEMKDLVERIKDLPVEMPVIVGGDFNSAADSKLMNSFEKSGRVVNTLSYVKNSNKHSWDAASNTNALLELKYDRMHSSSFNIHDSISAFYDTAPRTIDHIFVNNKFSPNDILRSDITMDSLINGVHASDHFGIMSEIDLTNVLKNSAKETNEIEKLKDSRIEPLPILTYDSDVGLGYGAKLFVLNKLKLNESFDAIAFNSTKGERWYRLVFSVPDFELRQGKTYPLSIDATVDYDKWIKNNFYGVGNNSKYENEEIYQKEPLEIVLAFGHTFSPNFITQAGIKYRTVRNSDFSTNSQLVNLPPAINGGRVSYGSYFLNLKYDSRNSFVNPTKGVVFQIETEHAPAFKMNNVRFTRFGSWIQYYSTLFHPTTILALRLGVQSVIGNDLPVQSLISLGGNSSLRGYPADRFLDKAAATFNGELRFPIYWRFGGIAGFDAGKVWSSLSKFDLKNWPMNLTAGLRFYMNTFVIRLDIGFSKESTRIYFNFGQIF